MPKIISQETARKIVELRDKERLSFKEIGKRLGLSPETVAKYYKIEKNKETSKSIEDIEGYEKQTIIEFLEYAKEHGLSIVEIAQIIYEFEKAGIDIRDVKKGIETFKALKEVGGEKDVKSVLSFLKEKKKSIDFLEKVEVEKKKEIEAANKKLNEIKEHIEKSLKKRDSIKAEIEKLKAEIEELTNKKNEIYKSIKKKALEDARNEWLKEKAEREKEWKKREAELREKAKEAQEDLRYIENELKKLAKNVILNPEFVLHMLNDLEEILRKLENMELLDPIYSVVYRKEAEETRKKFLENIAPAWKIIEYYKKFLQKFIPQSSLPK